MFLKITKYSKYLLDLLYPIQCIFCQKSSYYICCDCNYKLKKYENNRCPICNKVSKNAKTCKSCSVKSQISQVLAVFSYKDKEIKELIHLLKYKSIKLISRDISNIIFKELFNKIVDNKNCIICPVPMHQKKELKRGYNQADLLAKNLAKLSNLKCISDLLIKTKNIKPQMSFKNIHSRRNNVLNAIKFNLKYDLSNFNNKTIIIIDDVITTQSTINECEKALKNIKNIKIIVITVCKQNL